MRCSRIENAPARRGGSKLVLLGAALLLASLGCGKDEKGGEIPAKGTGGDSAITVTVGPTLRADIDGGSASADLVEAAVFAWEEFIALNWPAVEQNGSPGTRDAANASAPFGDPGFKGPLVWHTFRAKVEIFPGKGEPHGYNPLDSGTMLGYDDPPRYVYDSSVAAPPGASSEVPWINLDETSQVGLDYMYAGILPAAPSPRNSRPNLIRFLAKANRAEYEYVVRNHYWDRAGNYDTAVANFVAAIAKEPPAAPAKPFIDIPAGAVEVKAAWRQLAPGEDPSRFYTTKVRYYERGSAGIGYHDDTWGLVALHIMHKTPSAPSWIYATFEHADNILTADGRPVEDADGAVVAQVSGAPTQPALSYVDSPTEPLVSIVGGSYCDSPGRRLFYRNFELATPGLPSGGYICVNRRDNPIPPAIVRVNRAAHRAIADYANGKGIANSPWMHYKLVNVQASPFDLSAVDTSAPDGTHNPSTYYTANSMLETNHTLALYHGRFVGASGIRTDYPKDGTQPDFKNVYLFPASGAARRFNMGGCMGCHGMAQVTGTDFSFLLSFGPVLAPDLPPAGTAVDSVLIRKYRRFFAKREMF